jgi:hypothetical protein
MLHRLCPAGAVVLPCHHFGWQLRPWPSACSPPPARLPALRWNAG